MYRIDFYLKNGYLISFSNMSRRDKRKIKDRLDRNDRQFISIKKKYNEFCINKNDITEIHIEKEDFYESRF